MSKYDTANTEQLAEQMKHMIRCDIEQGALPANVSSWADLHETVDANEYVLIASQEFDVLGMEYDAMLDWQNAAVAIVDAWMKKGMK